MTRKAQANLEGPNRQCPTHFLGQWESVLASKKLGSPMVGLFSFKIVLINLGMTLKMPLLSIDKYYMMFFHVYIKLKKKKNMLGKRDLQPAH